MCNRLITWMSSNWVLPSKPPYRMALQGTPPTAAIRKNKRTRVRAGVDSAAISVPGSAIAHATYFSPVRAIAAYARGDGGVPVTLKRRHARLEMFSDHMSLKYVDDLLPLLRASAPGGT